MKLIAVSDVIINERFTSTKPRPSKLNRIRNYYVEHGCLDKPIIVNRKGVLLDGYIRYLILKENNITHTMAEVVSYIPKKRKDKQNEH